MALDYPDATAKINVKTVHVAGRTYWPPSQLHSEAFAKQPCAMRPVKCDTTPLMEIERLERSPTLGLHDVSGARLSLQNGNVLSR